MTKPGWDDEAIELAKAMYLNDGASHGNIARALGKLGYTLTRNAVLGKLYRLGISDGRTAVQRNDGAPKAPRVPKAPQSIEVIKPAKPLPKITRNERAIEYIGPIETTPAWGFCQYTRDDISKPGWQMCGHPAVVKGEGRFRTQTPWCEDHGRICHQPQQSKKRGEDAA